MTEPLVSIVIPNFNYAAFLPRAIDSALAQTYGKTEVIVVDDGSTDGSRAVIATYGDRIRAVLKGNAGHTSAINAGFAASRGSVICWLDSDDEFLPGKVEAVVDALHAHPDATLVYHRLQTVDVDGAEHDAPWPRDVWVGSLAERVAHAGGWWPRPTTSAMSFPRAFLSRLHPMRESTVPGEATWPDACAGDLAPFFGDVIGLPNALARYRVHGANNSESFARAEVRVQQYRFERDQLQAALAAMGRPERLDHVDRHLGYARSAYEAGQGLSPRAMALLIARNPLMRPGTKVREIAKLTLAGARRS